jgi:hypothetical protein
MFRIMGRPVLGAAALVAALAAGCSSPCGGRTCRKEPPGPPAVVPAAVPAPAAAGGPGAPPGGATVPAAPYGGQKTCPVTGEALGAMGTPVAVTVRAQTVYVCCRGCAAKAQADPEKTLAAVAAERAR